MKRMSMIKGTRRSAKQAVEKFIATALLKVEICSDESTKPIRIQLGIYRELAKEMGWTDLESRIDRALNQKQFT